jgi:YD repeat-containing protein
VLPIRFLLPRLAVAFFVAVLATTGFAQLLDDHPNDTIRVTVTVNADGSRTVCQFDNEHHKATATTSEPDGSLRGRIEYETDDAGRFTSGVVLGADEKFQFKALYKYDASGKLIEETHLNKDGALVNRIVYKYTEAGKPAGFSVFDAAGKLVSGTAATPTPNNSPKRRNSLGR